MDKKLQNATDRKNILSASSASKLKKTSKI